MSFFFETCQNTSFKYKHIYIFTLPIQLLKLACFYTGRKKNKNLYLEPLICLPDHRTSLKFFVVGCLLGICCCLSSFLQDYWPRELWLSLAAGLLARYCGQVKTSCNMQQQHAVCLCTPWCVISPFSQKKSIFFSIFSPISPFSYYVPRRAKSNEFSKSTPGTWQHVT